MKYQHITISAVRLITSSKKVDNIAPVLIDLHRLLIGSQINFKLLCLTLKVLHGLVPQYQTDLLKRYTPITSLHAAGQELLCVPDD